MNQQRILSSIPPLDQQNSYSKEKNSSPTNQDRMSDFNSLSPTQKKSKQSHQISNFNLLPHEIRKKQQSHIFIHFQTDTQIKVQKMIRDQIQMQGKCLRKMSLDNGQTCLCTSDIYTKVGVYWKNRQISQLTTKKLDSIPIQAIKKIKVLNQQPMTGYNLFKVTLNEKQIRDLAIRTVDIPLWFSNSIWICLVSAGCETNKVLRQFQGQIQGQILKKSKYLGNWQLRYISISIKNGLISKKKKDCKATVRIQQTAQMWTRLQIIIHENVKYVVIKIWHMMFKYEFGIPVTDCVRWSKAFSTLIK